MRLNYHYQSQGGESLLLVLLTLSHEFIVIFSKMDVIFLQKNQIRSQSVGSLGSYWNSTDFFK